MLVSDGAPPQVVAFNLNARPRNSPRAGVVTMCSTACVKPTQVLPQVSPIELQQLLSDACGKPVLFLDIREPEELVRSGVEGLRNLPMSELPMYWDELKSAEAVYLFCSQGNRSLMATETLTRLGLTNVNNVTGGYNAWVSLGLPVKKSALS